MKKELSTPTIVIVSLVVVGVLVAVGFAMFKPSIGQGPPVEPKPFAPPAGYRAPGQGAGGPMGAPASPNGNAPTKGS